MEPGYVLLSSLSVQKRLRTRRQYRLFTTASNLTTIGIQGTQQEATVPRRALYPFCLIPLKT